MKASISEMFIVIIWTIAFEKMDTVCVFFSGNCTFLWSMINMLTGCFSDLSNIKNDYCLESLVIEYLTTSSTGCLQNGFILSIINGVNLGWLFVPPIYSRTFLTSYSTWCFLFALFNFYSNISSINVFSYCFSSSAISFFIFSKA